MRCEDTHTFAEIRKGAPSFAPFCKELHSLEEISADLQSFGGQDVWRGPPDKAGPFATPGLLALLDANNRH